MRKFLSYIIPLVVVWALAASCSSLQRVINTDDPDLIFQRGLEYYKGEKWTKAILLFEHCEPYLKGFPQEDSVAYYRAHSYFKNVDYQTSATLFDEFRRTYGRSVFIENAEALYAISLYNMCPSPERDQTTTAAAIIAISEFLSHHPNSAQRDYFLEMTHDLTWRMEERTYLNAYTYYKILRYDSAIIAFRNALKKYPDSHRREDIMYYIVMSAYKFADNSVASKQSDRFMTMLDSYYSFIMEYPESKYRQELDQAAEVAKRYIEKNKADDEPAQAEQGVAEQKQEENK
ncbi:MAG: outer membrane protein assembly factor BamD [Rikenellaceae bacterium]|nr:outer membrane protein assembly factor BamD [Rikenellaceae bacterium]